MACLFMFIANDCKNFGLDVEGRRSYWGHFRPLPPFPSGPVSVLVISGLASGPF